MNLTSDPWIPAVGHDGRRELFSLLNLFAQAHTLRDLTVKPHERVALMRLLLCITQSALDGPESEFEWQDCQQLIQPRARDYLEKWRPALELFGDGERFLQVSNLQPGKETDEGNAATKLDLALATGNNSTLFDNFAGEDRKVQNARSCLNLLTFQCFAPGGRIGVAKWNGKETPGKGSSNHAPCTPSSMIHTILLGKTLLETVHQNLLSRESVTDLYGRDRWGRPVWELPLKSAQDKKAVENLTLTYLGRLSPLSRAIRLNEDGLSIILANGLDYPIFPAFREASATIITRKEELAILPASTSRSLWRQLGAISVKRRAGDSSASGPLVLDRLSPSDEPTIWVGALITDKAKIEDVVEAVYSLPSGMFNEFGRVAYEKGIAYAEEREGILIQSVKTYAFTLKVASPAYTRARQEFWTRVEQYLFALFDLARNTELAVDLPNCLWGKTVQAAAFDAYEQSCPRQTPRQIEAYVLGLRKLTFRPKNHQSTPVAHE
jgi:CRISPR system Cascade subunit CasA